MVPPLAGMYVTVQTGIPSTTLQTDGIMNCAPRSQYITPYSLVNSDEEGTCRILVVNLKGTPVHLKGGTHLGRVQAADDIRPPQPGTGEVKGSELRLGQNLSRSH